MIRVFLFIAFSIILYSCSPINKQHGYLMDDVLISIDKVDSFEYGKTTKNDIFNIMGSPSVQIDDINNVWIYILSFKEEHVFEEDKLTFQTIFRFEFDNNSYLADKFIATQENFRQITFTEDKTKIRRDAYGITDQLYEAFTRGQ